MGRHRNKIPVIVQEGYVVLNSHGSNHAINGVAYRDAFFREWSEGGRLTLARRRLVWGRRLCSSWFRQNHEKVDDPESQRGSDTEISEVPDLMNPMPQFRRLCQIGRGLTGPEDNCCKHTNHEGKQAEDWEANEGSAAFRDAGENDGHNQQR
jgi:hypothetical protein